MSKKEKVPPIMVGDIDIRPMTREQLIEVNNDFISKIYRIRREQSDNRRELGSMMTCIENILEKLEERHTTKLLTLADYELTPPYVVEESNNIMQHKKYIDYNLDKIGKLSMENTERENVRTISNLNPQAETKLWLINEKYETKLEALYKQCKTKLETKNDTYTVQKRKREEFQKTAKERYLARKEYYNNEVEKFKNFNNDYYLNRYSHLVMNANKDLRKYRLENKQIINECNSLAVDHLRRTIRYEDRLRQENEEYVEKIENIKNKIQNYEKELNRKQKEAAIFEKEISILRKKTNNIFITEKYIRSLHKKIEKLNAEHNDIKRDTNDSIKILKYNKDLGNKYCYLLDSVECNKQFENDEYYERNMKLEEKDCQYSLDNIAGIVVDRMEEILADMQYKPKQLIMDTLQHYIKLLQQLQFDVIRNGKSHNELIQYFEKYMHEMEFDENPIPFRKIKSLAYRKLTTCSYGIPCNKQVGQHFRTDK